MPVMDLPVAIPQAIQVFTDRLARETDGHAQLLYKGDELPLLIVFSAVNSNTFSFVRAFEQANANQLFVRDPHDAWYNRGVSATVADVPAIVRLLGDAIAALSPRGVMTFGSSMGGYASLLFGAELKADRIVAISPQTIIDPRLPHTPTRSFQDQPYFDLLPILARGDATGSASIYCGGSDLVDIYNGMRVAPFVSEVVAIRGEDHLLANFFTRMRYHLAAFDAFAAGETFAFDGPREKFVADPIVPELTRRCVEGFYLDAPDDPIRCAKALAAIHHRSAAVQHFLSVVLARDRITPGAMKAVLRANELDPTSITIANWKAELLLGLGDVAAAEAAFRQCLEIRPLHYNALCRLGEILARSGRWEESLTLIDQGVRIRPRLRRAQKLREHVLGRSLDAAALDSDKNEL